MLKLVALVSSQGTCCVETILTAKEDTPTMRETVEREFCTGKPDAPIAGNWVDVSENDEAQRCFADD